MQWWNIHIYDILDRKNILILGLIIYVLFALFRTREATFSCTEPYKYCTVTGTNSLKIKTTKNVIMAFEITGTSVERYKQSSGGRHHRSTYRYNLFAINKSGRKVKIFDNLYHQSYAEKIGGELMTCLKNKAYPCEIKN